jgi:hypothetical protein
MEPPVTVEQFYGVFRDYNTAVWPAQWFLATVALVAVAAALRPRPGSGAAVCVVLALLWTWIAMAFHLAFFAHISPPAYAFSALSMAGAAVFIWQGLPCPTTIFNIGVLCFAVPPMPRSPLIVPVLWCFVGAQAAFLLGVPADLGLVAAGTVGIGLMATTRQRHQTPRS